MGTATPAICSVKARAILAEPIEIVDGTVTARGPGLGLSWNEAAVAKYIVP
jgi:mandelate racemase